MRAALALAFAAAAGPAAAWRLYDAKLASACPAHHVAWLCGDCAIELVEAFGATLPAPLAHRVVAVADTRHACAAEAIGVGCAVGRSLLAYRDLGLLDRFVAYGCRTVRCEEAALCRRYPTAPSGGSAS